MQHPDPDALALAALPSEPTDPDVTAHLSNCRLCRDHVAALRRTVDLARDGSPDADTTELPPERVWEAISATITRHDSGAAVPPAVAARSAPAASRPRRTAALVGALALVVGVLAGATGGWIAGRQQDPPDIVAGTELTALPPVSGVALAPGTATAVMTTDGRLEIRLPGPPRTPPGTYLEVWVADQTLTDTVPLGVLRTDPTNTSTVLAMPAGLPDRHFTTLDVSVEPFAGDGRHSRQSLLRATFPP